MRFSFWWLKCQDFILFWLLIPYIIHTKYIPIPVWLVQCYRSLPIVLPAPIGVVHSITTVQTNQECIKCGCFPEYNAKKQHIPNIKWKIFQYFIIILHSLSLFNYILVKVTKVFVLFIILIIHDNIQMTNTKQNQPYTI